MPAGVRINHALWAFRAFFALIALGLLAMILRPEAFQAQPPPPPPVVQATVAPGRKQARGWVRMVATFYYAIGPTTCDSGRVPFAVGATSARPS
jgi:hypothetical protein